MKLFFIKFSIFLTLIFCSSIELVANEVKTIYKVELGNINIGSLKWVLNLDDDNYKTSIFLKNKGFVANLYKFTGEYFSEGKIIKNQFISNKYTQSWKTKRKTKDVELLFENTMVSSLILKPKEKEKPRIDYLEILGLVDPISSFINILINGENIYKTIDGRRIYNMSLTVEKKSEKKIIKKILITEYFNIWADHKRKDLKYFTTEQNLLKNSDFFPDSIKIRFKGLVVKLTKT